MSHITAHVLDAVAGTPASGLVVELAGPGGNEIANAITDADGRVRDLGPERLRPGVYTVSFATGDYFAGRQVATFYPQVRITFTVEADQNHYHVPLLLSPFAYSTYRGS